ncbi:MAG: hypothetical protein Q8N99_02820 [Nanoarchaeota archaeon]|nr:hypothetical protein [Nanoarchaeota archaeon]
MQENIENRVQGPTLPGHKAFCEWLFALSKTGKSVLNLGELDWAIRTQSMFQRDADVVRDFFKSLGEYLGTDSLKVVSYDGKEIPFVLLNGTKLPNTTLEIELYFAHPNPFSIARNISASSKHIYKSLEEFEGSEELIALRQALSEISGASRKYLATNNGVELIEDKDKLHFYAETNTHDDRLRRIGYLPNLTEVYDRTIATADAVEKSYTAAQRMIDSYKERIQGLAQRLMAPSTSG